jgi:hypothetical protein
MYQFAQAVASLPGTALLAGLTTLIIILMTKLNDPLWYFLNMFLSLTCAEALAMLVSHWVPHFVIGMALIAGMYGFFMLFMGFVSTFCATLSSEDYLFLKTLAYSLSLLCPAMIDDYSIGLPSLVALDVQHRFPHVLLAFLYVW